MNPAVNLPGCNHFLDSRPSFSSVFSCRNIMYCTHLYPPPKVYHGTPEMGSHCDKPQHHHRLVYRVGGWCLVDPPVGWSPIPISTSLIFQPCRPKLIIMRTFPKSKRFPSPHVQEIFWETASLFSHHHHENPLSSPCSKCDYPLVN